MIKFICQYGAKRLIIKSKGIEYGKEYEILLSFLLSFFPMVMMAQQKMTWEEAYRQADEIVAKLTLDEKLHFMRGYSEFFFYGVPEKGFLIFIIQMRQVELISVVIYRIRQWYVR